LNAPDDSLDPTVDYAAVVRCAAQLGARLIELDIRLSTIESCTGGLIAAALTETAGSSAWFERGWVTYSNESKIELVGVQAQTLASVGAVSEHTAAQMAAGGLAHGCAGIALAVTGIAGPGGGSPGKPVGTVCFGWAVRGGDIQTQTLCFPGDRAQVRLQTARHALRYAMQILSDARGA
jgi:nicotinamide-nucleotide amidase